MKGHARRGRGSSANLFREARLTSPKHEAPAALGQWGRYRPIGEVLAGHERPVVGPQKVRQDNLHLDHGEVLPDADTQAAAEGDEREIARFLALFGVEAVGIETFRIGVRLFAVVVL